MKIAFIVDAQSPIASNWMSYFIKRGHEVHILSTYGGLTPQSCLGAASHSTFQIGTSASARARQTTSGAPARPAIRDRVASSIRDSRLSQPAALGLVSITAAKALHIAPAVRARLDTIRPDIVHALRIPCEGILAARADAAFPLIVSTWGNDLTLFARYHPWLGRLTRQTLRRADALLSDCYRDAHLAVRWGFAPTKPSAVLPGAGGIQADIFYPAAPAQELRSSLGIADGVPVVINPRGFRGYVRNDTFFRAIPLVLEKYPETVFLCTAMQGNATAERWMSDLGIDKSVRLLPRVPREHMADSFRLAQVTVSPSTHDGTPNTLLEAMACGCFPVAGDIESVREWITDGANGLLFDPTDPEALASAVLRGLDDAPLRRGAQANNLRLIAERAEYNRVMAQAEAFYEGVLRNTSRSTRAR
jgi:glycosyltransferase involved in cell wall biosynthesis